MSRKDKAAWAGIKAELQARLIVNHHHKGWSCGTEGHYHSTKKEALRCFAIWWRNALHKRLTGWLWRPGMGSDAATGARSKHRKSHQGRSTT